MYTGTGNTCPISESKMPERVQVLVLLFEKAIILFKSGRHFLVSIIGGISVSRGHSTHNSTTHFSVTLH